MRRLLTSLVVAGVGVLALAPAKASAHANIASSEPAAGSRLERSPGAVVITFTEPVEPSFSSMQVLDSGGRSVTGKGRITSRSPSSLSIPVSDLPQGVYTVSWRAFSRVDGHTTAGSFSFGVGVSPTEAPPAAASEGTAKTSREEIAGRWLFLLGLVATLGGCLATGLIFRRPPPEVRGLVVTMLIPAFVGLAVLADAQRSAAGVGWAQFFDAFIGRAVVWRAAGLLPAVIAVAAPPSWGPGRRKPLFLLAALGASVTAFVHTAAGHAAGSPGIPQLQIAQQWVHIVAAGIWIGGLAALIVGVRGEPDEEKGAAVKRFSLSAGVAVLVVAVTGVLRAADSLSGWGDLLSTTYGQAVSIKAGLWVALALLGAINRYRHVPAAGARLKGLRWVSTGELALATLAIGSAAMLGSVPPTASTAASGSVRPLTVTGTDFGTSIRARLEVSPGSAGPNQFTLQLRDYDTEEPIDATASLRFTSLDDPTIADSTLPLRKLDEGTYEAAGANLSSPGRWEVTALVQRAGDAKQIVLRVVTRCAAQAAPAGGQPTIYTIPFPSGSSAQGYVDPGREGFNEVHLTLFDRQGREMEVGDTALFASTGADPRIGLPTRRFGRGHFVGDAQLAPGRWRFDFRSEAEEPLTGCFETTIPGGRS
ncbi:MAG: copper resistance protein CopC [Actinomycetota bacterium]|nr:copper resistance protein CopC [Actinomycetota bacterium]